MSKGDANSWKEEFFDTAKQTAAQNNATNVVSGIINIFYSVFTPVINAFCTRKLHL